MKLGKGRWWARLPRWIQAAFARCLQLTILSGRQVGKWRFLLIPWLLTTTLLGLTAWHFDHDILKIVHIDSLRAEKVAQFCSYWGDYQTYSVPLAITIWAYSPWAFAAKSRRYWRRVAMVCFLGASLTGLFNDFFRLSLGRPRPYSVDPAHGVVDTFYGPSFTWYGQYQSFPSGHAATSFGTGASLLMVNPPLGIAATLYAATICWARMDLQRHYPSDIAVGAMVGIFGGLCIGAAGRRKTHPR